MMGWRFTVAAAVLLVLGACHDASDAGAGAADVTANPDTTPVDTGGNVDTSTGIDTVIGTDANPPGDDTTPVEDTSVAEDTDDGVCNEFGCPCSDNSDCLEELCVEGPDGFICSEPCTTDCPDDSFACLLITTGADPFNACVPLHPNLCKPCDADSDCTNTLQPGLTGLCIPSAEPGTGSFCGSSCENSPCPDGYSCGDIALPGGGFARQCQPDSGMCECRPAWVNQNLSTSCLIENDLGTCQGSRSCGVDGLTACTGEEATAEVCNGIDDDCNGFDDDIEPVACDLTNSFGTCVGSTACNAGEEICVGDEAVAELCNALDDDCDGEVDEDTCSDGLFCTDDVCAGADTCENTLQQGFCVIDGQCITENTPNPQFPCQRCVPDVSTTTWTGGDGEAGQCFIEGECFPEGAGKPGEPCLRCRPEVDTVTWSPVSDTNVFCTDNLSCTQNDTCVAGSCIGDAFTCDDGLPCTADTCNGDGTCTFTAVNNQCVIDGDCYVSGDRQDAMGCMVCDPAQTTSDWSPATSALPCDDGEVCTKADVCDGATCGGVAYTCDDSLACTSDSCDGFGGCVAAQDADSCVIAGACYSDGDGNDTNPCLVCDVAISPTTWSPSAGNPCDDNNPCTSDDVCSANGCGGTPYTCDDGKSCTDDVCDGAGDCDYPVKAGDCLIGNTCRVAGQRQNPNNCRICDPATNQNAWSPATTALPCNDGDVCTAGDACDGLSCTGDAYSCDDNLACTADSCNGDGTCTFAQDANTCVIGGVCYDAGDTDATNTCRVCDPTQSRFTWSSAQANSACDDGDDCTHSDTCTGGACFGTLYDCDDGIECTTDVCNGDSTCDNIPADGPEICGNGLDDDCDGEFDELEIERCGDLVDNDCDGNVDESGDTWGKYFFARPWVTADDVRTVGIYRSNDDGTFQTPPIELEFDNDENWSILGIGDFDGDLFLDLVVGRRQTGNKAACSSTVPCAANQTCWGGFCNPRCTNYARVGAPSGVDPACAAGDKCIDYNFNGQVSNAVDRICASPMEIALARETCPDGAIQVDPLTTPSGDPVLLAGGESLGSMIDTDNNGHLDLVVIESHSLNSGYTLRNNTDFTFTAQPASINLSAFNGSSSCSWARRISRTPKDLNNDGIVDLVGACWSSGGSAAPRFWWWEGNGDGTFHGAASFADTVGTPTNFVSVNDFDGDGDNDIIAGLDDDADPGSVEVLLNTGSLDPTTSSAFGENYEVFDVVPNYESGGDRAGYGTGTTFDFSRDGFPDALAAFTPRVNTDTGTVICNNAWSCSWTELGFYRNITADGCGQFATCTNNACVACTPSCNGKQCGDDGCGGTCGSCGAGDTCEAATGQCVPRNACVPTCHPLDNCGDNGCGGKCGFCTPGDGCQDTGLGYSQCSSSCIRSCANKACGGDDGCGGQCALFSTIERVDLLQNQSKAIYAPTNSPPTAPEIEVQSSNPAGIYSANEFHTLYCVLKGETYDLDTTRVEFRWFRNGDYAKEVGDRQIVSPAYTSNGDLWRCDVRVTDGIERSPIAKPYCNPPSATCASNIITITN